MVGNVLNITQEDARSQLMVDSWKEFTINRSFWSRSDLVI